MKKRVLTLHFALFLQDIVDRPDVLFSELNKDMLNVFDGIPQSIPVPRELPAEVPILVLRSENNEYTCNISRSRIDFIISRVNDTKTNADMIKDFSIKVPALSKFITEKTKIIRFGMVSRYFYQDNTATRTLRNKFFSQAVDGAEELSLRYNRKSNSFGFEVNDIHEITAAAAITDGKQEMGILIQKDINNNQANNKQLDPDVLLSLFNKYIPKISELEMESLLK